MQDQIPFFAKSSRLFIKVTMQVSAICILFLEISINHIQLLNEYTSNFVIQIIFEQHGIKQTSFPNLVSII